MKKIVIITGASSGFGKSFATQLDNMLSSVDEYWLIARNKTNLEELASNLKTKAKVMPIDLTYEASVSIIVDEIKREHAVVKMLVNSAGFGKLGEVSFMKDGSCSDMIKLNCLSLTMLTKRLLPYMDYNSRIINIASSAAFLPQPEFAIYAATKSYVLSFTRALNVELKKYAIYATAVCPGPSATNFFNIAEESSKSPSYKKYFLANPDKIVKLAITDSINKKDMSVYSLAMKAFCFVSSLLPHRLILKFFR